MHQQSASQREGTRRKASRTLSKRGKINGSNNCKTYHPHASIDIPTGDSSFTPTARDSCALSPCLGSALSKQRRYQLTGSKTKAAVTNHSLQAAPNRVLFRCKNISATNSSRNTGRLLSNIGVGCEVHVRWTGVDVHISLLLQPCALALLSSHIIKHPRNTTIVMLAICITTDNVLLYHTAAHGSDTERVKPRHFLNRRKQDRTQAVSIH